MRIGVERERDGGVTQRLRDDLRMDVRHQKRACVGMSQVVEARPRHDALPSRKGRDRPVARVPQLTEALAEYLRSRGGVTEAQLFFETLGERMQTLRELLPCPNCGSTDFAVKPVLELPG